MIWICHFEDEDFVYRQEFDLYWIRLDFLDYDYM